MRKERRQMAFEKKTQRGGILKLISKTSIENLKESHVSLKIKQNEGPCVHVEVEKMERSWWDQFWLARISES